MSPNAVLISTGSACTSGICQTTTTTTLATVDCQQVTFYNPSNIQTVVTYIDCDNISRVFILGGLLTSYPICLFPLTIVSANTTIAIDIVNPICSPSPTTTTTAAPTTTTTTNAYTACATNWTKQNLTVTTYANGDVIPEVTDPTAWSNLTTGAWCYYNNDPVNEPVYGRLYNYYALVDPRGLDIPTGYRLPTTSDWSTLKSCVGNSAAKLKSTTGWATGTAPIGTNETGFTALPGGIRAGSSFTKLGENGYWWNSDSTSGNFIGTNSSTITSPIANAEVGMSVRLIKI